MPRLIANWVSGWCEI